MSDVRLILGDSLEVLPTLEADSVDSVCTDPPAGIGFMSKNFDTFTGRDHFIDFLASVLRECLRVLKPGGYAFVWALPRTSHWTATAIEDAGFEVRDKIYHHFGQGFPKGKGCLKPSTEEWISARKPGPRVLPLPGLDECRVGYNGEEPANGNGAGRWPPNLVLTHSALCQRVGTKRVRGSHHNGETWQRNVGNGYREDWQEAGTQGQPYADADGLETVEDWLCADECPVRLLNLQTSNAFDDSSPYNGYEEEESCNANASTVELSSTPGQLTSRKASDASAQNGAAGNPIESQAERQMPGELSIRETDAGTGNGESQKPGDTSTRCLKTDGSGSRRTVRSQKDTTSTTRTTIRPTTASITSNVSQEANTTPTINGSEKTTESSTVSSTDGASDVESTSPLTASLFDGLEPTTDTANPASPTTSVNGGTGTRTRGGNIGVVTARKSKRGSSSEPARFFPQFHWSAADDVPFLYCPKASKRERGEGNGHPCVKPLSLVRWLVRLITPPGGLCLDPFLGSGTGAVACLREGRRFIGIEQDEDYHRIALARVEHARQQLQQEAPLFGDLEHD